MRYWVRVNKDSLGPFTPEQIRQHPEVTESTLVYPETAKDAVAWKRLREVPELLRATTRAPSAPAKLVQVSVQPINVSPSRPADTAPGSTSPVSRDLPGGQTEKITNRMAIVALSLAILNIPWDYVAFNGMARLLGGRVEKNWTSLTVVLLVPLLVNLVLATVAWFRANKSTSRSGTGLATVALVIGVIHLVLVSLFSIILYRAAHKDAPMGLKPIAQKTEQPAVAAADSWAGRADEAMSLMKGFPVRKVIFPRCPRNLNTVADVVSEQGITKSLQQVETWPQVHTVPEAISCKQFMPVALLLLMTTEMQKKAGVFRGAADIAKQVRENPDAFRKYEISVTQAWSVKQSSGPNYIVEVDIHEEGLNVGGPVDKRTAWKWQVNLLEKTVRPLNAGAWISLDSSAAGTWIMAEVQRDPTGQVATQANMDMVDVSAVAPIFQGAATNSNGSETGEGSP